MSAPTIVRTEEAPHGQYAYWSDGVRTFVHDHERQGHPVPNPYHSTTTVKLNAFTAELHRIHRAY